MREYLSYKGWRYNHSPSRPNTGVWRAERAGVTLSADNEELLKRMIDQRIRDYPASGGA